MSTIQEPIAPITEPTPLPIDMGKDTCYICNDSKGGECHFCERPICYEHMIELPHWCQLMWDACPDCFARKERGEL